jgi:hypothetical protein
MGADVPERVCGPVTHPESVSGSAGGEISRPVDNGQRVQQVTIAGSYR